MSVCRNCAFFIPRRELVARPQTPLEIANRLTPVAEWQVGLRGTCIRYPQTVEKWRDEWCGEWKEQPQ